MSSIFSETHTHRLVHLDLKGAAPRVEYLDKVIPLFSSWGATGLLIEYEDMFPYTGDLAHLKNRFCYTVEDVERIKQTAAASNLIVIPLIQTFGHLEFVLKHDQNRFLREQDSYPNAICPMMSESFQLVSSLIHAIMKIHTNSEYLHIGADEVWHLGKCEKCLSQMKSNGWTTQHLFLDLIKRRCTWIKEAYPGTKIIIWDDMLRNISVPILNEYSLNSYVQPMIWNYEYNFQNLPSDIFDRYSKVFDNIWAASAFKGATGSTQYMPIIQHHINNQLSWVETIRLVKNKFKCIVGIALTGWQRYDHYAVLCELLPVSLPSLCISLHVVRNGVFTKKIHEECSQMLGFSSFMIVNHLPRPQEIEYCTKIPGSDLFVGVQEWSNCLQKYQTFCSSQTMVGWFNDYFRSRNFTNPAQVESILYSLSELFKEMSFLRDKFQISLKLYFYEDTCDEWIGCYFDPVITKMKNTLDDCEAQLKIGARIKNYILKS